MFAEDYLKEVSEIAGKLDREKMEFLADELFFLGGRLFIIGLGGSASNASHACNDFRKLCGIDAYCLSDNVSELTAIANDFGWDEIYSEALKTRNADDRDALLVLSVGGGTEDVSKPLIKAIDHALERDMRVLGIVGRGGYTLAMGHVVVCVPCETRVTPHAESFQSVILHYLVSHPHLQQNKTKW